MPDIAATEHPGADIAVRLYARQQRGESLYFVARVGGIVCGTGELLFGDLPEIRHLHVDDEYRGRGVGTAIIRAAENRVNGPRVMLGVGVENADARRLYERLGYTGTGVLTTTTFSYVDASGVERVATEVDEDMVKTL